jgi:catalase
LSLLGRARHTLMGRKVGILFSDGSKKAIIDELSASIKQEGGTPMLIAPRVGGIKVEGGTLKADGQLAGTPSVLVDAIALVLTEDAAEKLCSDSAAVGFVADAFAHLKAIGFATGAQALLDRAGVQAGEGVTDDLGTTFLTAAAQRFFEREPHVRNLC